MLVTLFAVELFGQQLPAPGIAAIVFLILVGIFFYSRNDLGTGRTAGRGRMYRCERCGRDFQPERVELLSNGDTRHYIDERCPNCGWNLDWGDPDKHNSAW